MPSPSPVQRAPRRFAILLATACSLALVATLSPATLPAFAYDDPTSVDGMVLDGDGNFIVNDVTHTELAPGLDQVAFERIGPEGRQQLQLLRVQLADSNLKVDYIGNDAVTDPGTITEFVDQSGAIAGINGDFFDINNSSAPLGAAISGEDGLIKSPEPGREAVAGFSDSGLGGVVEILLEGTVTTPSGTLPLAGINRINGDSSAVLVYNEHWGEADRTRSVPAGQTAVEVLISADNTVIQAATAPGSELLVNGVQALVAHSGAQADALAALQLGDEVTVEYRINSEAEALTAAVGGHPTGEPAMLEDGVIGEATSDYMKLRHPRTGVGYSAEGDVAYFVVADGRQGNAAGLTVPDFGQLMLDLGAWDAINLDGGGSSQMNARQPGDANAKILNSPSDGYERSDANGLGIFLRSPGSDAVVSFDIRTSILHEDADRVFPGLRRTVTAVGVTENGSAAGPVAPAWTASGEAVTLAADGSTATVTGVTEGTTTLTASHGSAAGERKVDVLGPLTRISASTGLLALNGIDDTRQLTITGHDANGFQAPIDPADVEISGATDGLLEFVPSANGTFTVRALQELGSAALTFTVAGHSVEVPSTVGLTEILFADLADAAEWTAAHDRAPGGTVAPAPGHEGDHGLSLSYDFTQSTATRGQYAVAPNGGVALPGQPQKLTMWINGDGNGAWPRLQFRQANGTTANLDGPMVTWTGWQQAEFSVPAGVTYPLVFQRFRLMETAAAAQYTGEITISSLAVAVAPEVEMPATTVVKDPIVVADGATDEAPLRVAVISDAQFVGRNPDSEMVVGARRALQEIVAADPDMLVINGDFVDEAAPEDFDLARRILDEELAGADFPWYYVPGNHEIMGGAISNFTEEFGANFQTVDRERTRFIMLDSSNGALSGKVDQLDMLQAQLADAASSSSITGVVLLQHHPLDDPLPTKSSQLSNRDDAALLRDWLEEFRETSGKSAAFVGSHVGVFHATHEDGIPYLINGNSGKAPAGSPFGDFTGWTMLGIDPAQGAWGESSDAWLQSEVQTRVDSISFDEIPETVQAGERIALQPTIAQPGKDAVAVSWPMSFRWSSTDNVHVGDVADAPTGAIAALDPVTHVLTGLAEGAGSVTLTLNGVSETVEFGAAGGAVLIEGVALQDETLTGVLHGWEAPDTAEVTYQWLRDGEPIADATATTYLVGTADEGHRLAWRVTLTTPGQEPLTFTSIETALVPPADVIVPTLQLVADEVRAGEEIELYGSDFTADAALEVWLHSDPVLLGEARTDADGAFELRVAVAANTTPGVHSVRVTDPETGVEASVTLMVLAAAGEPGAGGSDGSEDSDGLLGVTGGEPAMLLIALSVLLVAGGGGLALWRIRRRSAVAEELV